MPFTAPLRNITAPPTRLANWVDDQVRPTKEFVDYLNRLRDWQVSVQAALTELEPPWRRRRPCSPGPPKETRCSHACPARGARLLARPRLRGSRRRRGKRGNP